MESYTPHPTDRPTNQPNDPPKNTYNPPNQPTNQPPANTNRREGGEVIGVDEDHPVLQELRAEYGPHTAALVVEKKKEVCVCFFLFFSLK